MLNLQPRPLTARDFAPFGDVIETEGHTPQDMNYGMALRWPALARIETDDKGSACIGRVHARKYPLPWQLRIVERHPLGSQAFVPLDEMPFIVVVGAAGDTPQPQQLKAFVSNGRQGIHYRRGVWHGLLLTPFDEMDFLVVDRCGPGDNCEEHRYSEAEAPWIQV